MPLTLHVNDAMADDGIRLYDEGECGVVISTQGNPERDRQPEDCCHGGLFLPDETYVPTTLAQVHKVFRAMRSAARIGHVPGERACCVADEELMGFTIFCLGRNNNTQRVLDRPVAMVPFEACLDPRCSGTLNKAGVCSVCGTVYIDGAEFGDEAEVEMFEEAILD